MAYRHIDWSVDDLFILSKYPQKTVREIADELHMHWKTVRRKLVEQGKEIRRRGRNPKDYGAVV